MFILTSILQSSWIDKLSTRVSNLKKRAARKLANRDEPGTPGKRGKKLGRKSVTQQLSQRYPIHIGSQDDTEEDEESCERHFKAISKELEKAKPSMKHLDYVYKEYEVCTQQFSPHHSGVCVCVYIVYIYMCA